MSAVVLRVRCGLNLILDVGLSSRSVTVGIGVLVSTSTGGSELGCTR